MQCPHMGSAHMHTCRPRVVHAWAPRRLHACTTLVAQVRRARPTGTQCCCTHVFVTHTHTASGNTARLMCVCAADISPSALEESAGKSSFIFCKASAQPWPCTHTHVHHIWTATAMHTRSVATCMGKRNKERQHPVLVRLDPAVAARDVVRLDFY